MTDAELEAIEARANAATEGPWGFTYDGSSAWSIGPVSDPQLHRIANVYSRGKEVEQADPEFIAAARTDVPKLVAEVRRLRALLGVK
jgi:hypothetical protein